MKILGLVFLLFGFAAAVSYEDLERARDEVIMSFMIGMEKAPSLRDAMGMDFAELDEDGTKTELVKTLKEALDTLLRHIKDSIDHGKEVKEDMLEHVEKIKEQLRKLHENVKDKLQEFWERIKEKTIGKLRDRIKEWWLKWNKEESEAYAAAENKFELRKFLEDLRAKLEEKGADLIKLKDEIKEKLKDHAMLAKLLLQDFTEESIEKVKRFIDRLLRRDNKESRSIKDLYEKIKDYLKDARDDFKEHYSKFLDWLETVYKSGAEAAKDRIENLKKVALKFIEHVDEVGKKTADEALEFFRPYKEDLGTLWDELEKSIKKAYGKH